MCVHCAALQLLLPSASICEDLLTSCLELSAGQKSDHCCRAQQQQQATEQGLMLVLVSVMGSCSAGRACRDGHAALHNCLDTCPDRCSRQAQHFRDTAAAVTAGSGLFVCERRNVHSSRTGHYQNLLVFAVHQFGAIAHACCLPQCQAWCCACS